MNRIGRLLQIVNKPARLVIGLMSGTSVDGIDAVLVRIEGHGAAAKAEQIAFHSYPFPPDLRAKVFRLFDPREARVDSICQLDFLLGEVFAAAVDRLLKDCGRVRDEVDLVASAGQTIWHDPRPVVEEPGVDWIDHPLITRSTFAIGQSAVIAERTGITTIGDLRVRDVAAGGHGAPLVAYADWVLLRDAALGRCVQNIGGIGNVTYLPPGATPGDVIAFDTGPGNMVIDALVDLATDGAETYDQDGKIAAQGQVAPRVLAAWLGDRYFRRPPPKTTGREHFGVQFARRLMNDARALSFEDLVATATALTAASIARAYRDFIRPLGPIDQVIVGGGGKRNPTLMAMLRERLPGGLSLLSHEDFGIDSDAKEAIALAIIANDAVAGFETNISGATGGRPTVLGKISL
ncbi:MAG TPA: anhydro-N-acetylmuramic acid kinase [Thermoanaerobaculia bacterium]|nr:anhydro-N-acetylmuramic acid kinase [Thermoanaerobaculia bacterium]